jgi:polysaccharide transporter, PST family
VSQRVPEPRKVARNLAWVSAASSVVGVLDIVSKIVLLAFFVSAGEFGVVTMAAAFFPALDLATDLGLSAAVIQRDDHTREKISTVFWLNVGMSAFLFLLIAFVFGPLLARFHDQPVIGWLLTVYAGKLIFQNVYFIPAALMRREMRFAELSVVRVIANFAEFAAKIAFAAAGWGVWAFVLAPMCRVVITGIGIQLCHPWVPTFSLRLRDALDWARFGFRTSGSQILYYLYTNADYQVVGRFFGDRAVGIYTFAYEVVLEPVRILSDIIVQIAFPTFARLKDKRDALIAQFRAFTRMNLIVMALFIGVVFAAGAELLVLVGNEYAGAETAMRILCFVGILRALSHIVPPLLDGLGRPQLTLTYTVTAAVLLPTLFVAFAWLLGPRLGFLSVALAWAIGYPIAFAVLVYLALQLLDLRLSDYLAPLKGIAACALVSLAAALGVHFAVSSLPPLAVVLASGGTMVALFLTLLAYTQGISPRTVARMIKGDTPKPADVGVPPDPTLSPASSDPPDSPAT